MRISRLNHMGLPLPSSKPEVWATGDTSIQVTWGNLGPGKITTHCSPAAPTVVADHGGGPGAVTINGLEPGTSYTVRLDLAPLNPSLRHQARRVDLTATTLTPPPGELLSRVATISDMHIGARHWGLLKQMFDNNAELPDPFPLRCARSAFDEIRAWQPDLVVVKGDATHHQDIDHFEAVGQLFDAYADLEMIMIPGNHEVDEEGYNLSPVVPATLGERELPIIRTAEHRDLPGLRVVAADTTVEGAGKGTLSQTGDQTVDLVAQADGPYLVAIHHHLQRYPFPTYYPLGIPAPSSTSFLERLAQINPNGFVTSGHTHRNRTRHHENIPVTEVASTRDWPGVWAGYSVYEGGISQCVWRTPHPDAISWHEYSRTALLCHWQRWSSGTREQRCFTHRWTGI